MFGIYYQRAALLILLQPLRRLMNRTLHEKYLVLTVDAVDMSLPYGASIVSGFQCVSTVFDPMQEFDDAYVRCAVVNIHPVERALRYGKAYASTGLPNEADP